MPQVTMRELKAITKDVVVQLIGNIQKLNTPEFQENFPYTYDGQEGVASFVHTAGVEVITFDIYGIKTGFRLPIDGPRETASDYVAKVYNNREWIAEEYLRVNKPQIKAKYERIKALNKLN